MGQIIHRVGDIFNTDLENIGHGTNCRGIMGSGIAAQVADRFPETEAMYKILCDARGEDLAGTIQPVLDYDRERKRNVTIINMFTQVEPGPNADYDLLDHAVRDALGYIEQSKSNSLAIPKVGAGVGGLDWDKVEEIIADAVDDHDVTLEIWTYDK